MHCHLPPRRTGSGDRTQTRRLCPTWRQSAGRVYLIRSRKHLYHTIFSTLLNNQTELEALKSRAIPSLVAYCFPYALTFLILLGLVIAAAKLRHPRFFKDEATTAKVAGTALLIVGVWMAFLSIEGMGESSSQQKAMSDLFCSIVTEPKGIVDREGKSTPHGFENYNALVNAYRNTYDQHYFTIWELLKKKTNVAEMTVIGNALTAELNASSHVQAEYYS
jgi:hypothetical protein